MFGSQALRQTTLYRYRFGTAEFDEAGAELRVGGIPIDLQKKPLEILAFLLRHSGEIVTKEELLEAIWPGMTTVENVVANAMTKLRNALGDENAARIITQPRIGYRFNGPVERLAAGRSTASVLDLKPGMPMPGRENFALIELIGGSPGSEVWTARQGKSREIRVYKISSGGAHVAALKREATLVGVTPGQGGPSSLSSELPDGATLRFHTDRMVLYLDPGLHSELHDFTAQAQRLPQPRSWGLRRKWRLSGCRPCR